MVEVAARLVLAGVLVAAVALKLSRPRESAAALATYGLRAVPLQWGVWGTVIAVELGLATGIAMGSDLAAYLAAGTMALFGIAMAVALAAGRGGRSCACFGARSRLGWPAVGRNALLAAAFLALPALPGGELSTEQWLGLGLAVAIAWAIGLSVALLALAREVGELRMRLGPAVDSALEIPEEGPPLGEPVAMAAEWVVDVERGTPEAGAELVLATFHSEGCHICRALEPQIRAFGESPLLVARMFDEVSDSEVWSALSIPGSPYAVALDLDGTVLAKGSFNTIAQLESVVATAERRRAAARLAGNS